MTRKRWVLIALAPVVLILVTVGSMHLLANDHMQAMAATGQGNTTACTMCHGPKGPPGGGAPMGPHAAPWALAATNDGRALFVASTGTQAIARIDVAKARIVRTFNPGGTVRGLDVAPDGQLAASLTDRDQVVLLDPEAGRVTAEVPVGRSPAGVAFDATGERLFVANMASHDVSVIDMTLMTELRRVPAGREPFTVRRAPGGATIAVVSRRMELTRPEDLPYSVVTLLDASSGDVRHVVRLPSCHMAESAAFTRDGAHLLVPAILVRNRLPILQVARGWVMSSVLAVIGVESGSVKLLPLSEPGEGFPDPSGIAVSRDGLRAFVASGGRDEVAEVDIPALLAAAEEADAGQMQRLSWTRRYVPRRFAVGSNPREVLLVGSKAAPRLAVSERLGDSVALVDVSSAEVDRVALGPGTDDVVQKGARVFHSARFAFQQAFSCRSCHPDGHTDGLTYDFDIDGVGRNVVLNRSLRGVAGTAPFKWTGINPTLQRQCGPRFAMVLTRADPMSDEELNTLVAYLHSLRPPRADPYAGRVAGDPTGAIERGKVLFERSVQKDGTPIPASGRCITCHPPPLFSTRRPADVGTKGLRDKTGLFDIPHLIGIGSKAPYLHDGRALSLEEIWTAPDVGDKHGVVSDLNKADLNDLVEYMKGL